MLVGLSYLVIKIIVMLLLEGYRSLGAFGLLVIVCCLVLTFYLGRKLRALMEMRRTTAEEFTEKRQ
jgi:hypothetical protein